MFLTENKLQHLFPRRRWLRVLLFIGILLGGMLAVFWAGMERGIILARHYGLDSPKPYITEVLPHRFRMERNSILGKMADFPVMDIQLGHEALSQLEYKRAEALRVGYLIQSEEDWVKANISYEGAIIPAKVRLKGDLLDHVKGDKWSLRIKLKGDETLLGMKLFSVQHPKTRDYLGDWLFQKAAQREGLIVLRHHFIPLQLNGESKGVYLLEEGFEKRLLEHNQHREGIILKFNENAFWQERRDFLNRPLAGSGHYLAQDFDSFQSEKTEADSSLSQQLALAESLLESFRRGELKTSEVFAIDEMARFVALADLFGVAHAMHSNQFRFYLNPLDQRLYPIPYDTGAMTNLETLSCALAEEDDSHWIGGGRVLFLAELFQDTAFFDQYLGHLNRMAQPVYLDNLIAAVDGEIDAKMQVLAEEFPLRSFSWEVLNNNQLYVRQWLYPHEAIKAHIVALKNGVLTLEVGNRQQLPVWIGGISVGTSNPNHSHSQTQSQTQSHTLTHSLLPGRSRWQQVKFNKISFPYTQPDSMLKQLEISWMIPGTDSIRMQKVLPRPALQKELLAQRPQESFRWFNGLVVDDTSMQIGLKSGNWQINRPLVIPKGYIVEIEPGFKLDVQQAAYVWSESPVVCQVKHPEIISIFSSDSTGQGFYLHHPGKQSLLNRMYFENIQAPARQGWNLTGAVTIYDSKVVMEDCHFTQIHAEDALNLVRCSFSLNNVFFTSCSSDGLDIDFGKGVVAHAHFRACQNDALDISGSVVQAKDLLMENIGDKGLSAGEASRVIAVGLELRDVWLGIAAKDQSEVSVNDIEHIGGTYGLVAYQKKSEFGGGKIIVGNYSHEQVERPLVIEKGSEMVIGYEVEKGEVEDVFGEIYGVKNELNE